MFYESFYDFFFIWSLIYFSLEYMKTTRSWFCVFSRGKTSKFKSRKNRLKSTFSNFFFYRTYYFGKRHDMIQCTTFKNHFLKNTCNLRHSNEHKSSIKPVTKQAVGKHFSQDGHEKKDMSNSIIPIHWCVVRFPIKSLRL